LSGQHGLSSALVARLQSNSGLKLFLLATLPAAVTLGYLGVQRTLIFPARRVPVTSLDRMVPFDPRWVWAYLSLYVLNPIGPLFTRSREELIDYSKGILSFFLCGFVCFVFFPVAGPRTHATANDWLYQRLVVIDRPYNSFPSLHAACAVYAVFFAAYASRDTTRPRLRTALLVMAWLWVAVILYSTIATRQHFFADLPAGMFLGWLAHRLFVVKTSSKSNITALTNEEAA
jgi:membrane-associated phospholipid phosphatase